MSTTKAILEAIQDEIQTNSTFSYIVDSAVYIVQALQEEYVSNISTSPPFVLIYPAFGAEYESAYVNCVKDNVTYMTGISFFGEYWDADIGMVGDGSTITGVTEMAADCRAVFNRNVFSGSALVLKTEFRSESYAPVGFISFENQSLPQVHCILEMWDETA